METVNPLLPALRADTTSLLRRAGGLLDAVRGIQQEGNSVYWFEKGQSATKEKRWQNALDCYSNCLAIDASDWDAVVAQTRALIGVSKLPEAIDSLLVGIKSGLNLSILYYLFSSDEWLEIECALFDALRSEEKQKSSSLKDKLFSLWVADKKCAYNEYTTKIKTCLSIVQMGRKNWQKSIEMLEEMNELCAENHDAFHFELLGQCHCKLITISNHEHEVPAILAFDKSLEIDNTSARNFLSRAWVLRYQKEYDKALADYGSAIRMSSSKEMMFSSYSARAYTYEYILNKFDLAILDYNEMLKLYPNDAPTYSSIGDCMDYLGDYSGAIFNYSKAISLDCNEPNFWRGRGLAKRYFGDEVGEKQDLAQANKLEQQRSKK